MGLCLSKSPPVARSVPPPRIDPWHKLDNIRWHLSGLSSDLQEARIHRGDLVDRLAQLLEAIEKMPTPLTAREQVEVLRDLSRLSGLPVEGDDRIQDFVADLFFSAFQTYAAHAERYQETVASDEVRARQALLLEALHDAHANHLITDRDFGTIDAMQRTNTVSADDWRLMADLRDFLRHPA